MADLYGFVSGGWFAIFALSAIACAAIIFISPFIPVLTGAHRHIQAVQSAHMIPTPRLGGIGLFVALVVTLLFYPDVSDEYVKLLLAASVLFIVCMAEDLGYGVSPRSRLMVAFLASGIAILLLDTWLPRTDIPYLDGIMVNWIVGVPITLLVTAGIVNGFNLIDGVNGLATLVGLVGAVSLAMIAHTAGQNDIAQLNMLLVAGLLGFAVWNYPFGRIFLGDAGAYVLGFILSWFAILIVAHSPEASPWSLLLTMFWPVADTGLAIWRRARRNAPKMQPDRLHFHQLVMRAIEIRFVGRANRDISNPLATVILAPFVMAPPAVGVLLWDKSFAGFIATLGFAVLFFASYRLGLASTQQMRNRRRLRHVKSGQTTVRLGKGLL